MEAYNLEVELREGTGKGLARKLRATGRIPAILYGLGNQARSLSVDWKDTEKYLREVAGMTLVRLIIRNEGEAYVIVKDYQLDPVLDRVIHVDFLEVDLEKKTDVEVPFSFEGKAKGVELGGHLEVINRSIEVRCLPGQIPDSIKVDVTSLMIGDVLHLKDVTFPEGIEISEESDFPVVSVQEVMEIIEEVEEVEEVEEGTPEEGTPEKGTEESSEDSEKD